MPKVLTRAKQRQQYHLNGRADDMQTEGALAPCRTNPEAFIDYEDAEAPEVYEAQVTCVDCPFFDICRERARLDRPVWGVHAGEVWDGTKSPDGRGRIVRRMRRRQVAARAGQAIS